MQLVYENINRLCPQPLSTLNYLSTIFYWSLRCYHLMPDQGMAMICFCIKVRRFMEKFIKVRELMIKEKLRIPDLGEQGSDEIYIVPGK